MEPFEKKRTYMEDRIQHGIEMNRKGFATLRFTAPDGNPVKNIHVEVKQKTHDFKYGANLFMLDEFNHPEQNEAYKKLFAEAFNMATLPFYWSDLEPEPGKPRFAKDSPKVYRRPAPDLCLEYCEANGIQPKAHCLNYASFAPKWVPPEIAGEKRLLDKRFRELAERYAHRIPDWEVTNETWWGYNHRFPFYNEPDFVEWSFETARRYFHTNRLIINEAHSRIWNNEHFYRNRSPYFMQIERALAGGARIDSIGMQYHMFYRAEDEIAETAQYYDPERIFDVLDCYAKLGRPIQITELTIPAYRCTPEDEEIQAEILRNIYRMWFSHPAMEAILYWNLVDGFAYGTVPGDMTAGENYYHGGLVRYDFTPKPSYFAIKELFGKTWRTNLSLDSGDSGELMFKGFYGEYELAVSAGNKTVTKTFHLDQQHKNELDIVIPQKT
ncbi:MAG: Endo-1,4-beta-xylanase A [Lentisphaerae bacterium ADurb.Bin242]|nr:MAG: Endo-1,4-beta-xylanase A [Lentisphaerae bacterium ADurb.Bin242]